MGWGRGRGRGHGRGWRAGQWGIPPQAYGQAPPASYDPQQGYAVAPAPEQETAMLKQQAQNMESALEEIKQRIDELEAEKPQNQ
jgi:hypothetical protein